MEATRIQSHKDIDRRLHRLVAACVVKIDESPELLDRARAQAARNSNEHIRKEWKSLLDIPWARLRVILLENSDEGDRIRQSVPFGGFLSNDERMRIINSPF
jgi:hypothetical protein